MRKLSNIIRAGRRRIQIVDNGKIYVLSYGMRRYAEMERCMQKEVFDLKKHLPLLKKALEHPESVCTHHDVFSEYHSVRLNCDEKTFDLWKDQYVFLVVRNYEILEHPGRDLLELYEYCLQFVLRYAQQLQGGEPVLHLLELVVHYFHNKRYDHVWNKHSLDWLLYCMAYMSLFGSLPVELKRNPGAGQKECKIELKRTVLSMTNPQKDVFVHNVLLLLQADKGLALDFAPCIREHLVDEDEAKIFGKLLGKESGLGSYTVLPNWARGEYGYGFFLEYCNKDIYGMLYEMCEDGENLEYCEFVRSQKKEVMLLFRTFLQNMKSHPENADKQVFRIDFDHLIDLIKNLGADSLTEQNFDVAVRCCSESNFALSSKINRLFATELDDWCLSEGYLDHLVSQNRHCMSELPTHVLQKHLRKDYRNIHYVNISQRNQQERSMLRMQALLALEDELL